MPFHTMKSGWTDSAAHNPTTQAARPITQVVVQASVDKALANAVGTNTGSQPLRPRGILGDTRADTAPTTNRGILDRPATNRAAEPLRPRGLLEG